jgi:hypothetical protein
VLDHVVQHRTAPERQEHLPGQAGGRHARLNDADDAGPLHASSLNAIRAGLNGDSTEIA